MNNDGFTVHLVDDEEDVTRALAWLLESVGIRSSDYQSALGFLGAFDESAEAACLVVDLRMPDMGGLELMEQINQRHWDLPVIFLTAHGDVPAAVRAMQLGAIDFVQKPFNPQSFLGSIHKAQRLARSNFTRRTHQTELARQLRMLSVREREILKYLTEGMTSKEIGRVLDISYKTVDVHRGNLMKKMQVASYVQLMRKLSDERVHAGTAAH